MENDKLRCCFGLTCAGEEEDFDKSTVRQCLGEAQGEGSGAKQVVEAEPGVQDGSVGVNSTDLSLSSGYTHFLSLKLA